MIRNIIVLLFILSLCYSQDKTPEFKFGSILNIDGCYILEHDVLNYRSTHRANLGFHLFVQSKIKNNIALEIRAGYILGLNGYELGLFASYHFWKKLDIVSGFNLHRLESQKRWDRVIKEGFIPRFAVGLRLNTAIPVELLVEKPFKNLGYTKYDKFEYPIKFPVMIRLNMIISW